MYFFEDQSLKLNPTTYLDESYYLGSQVDYLWP